MVEKEYVQKIDRPSDPSPQEMTTGAIMIMLERERQREKWSPEHDNGHDGGELIKTAVKLITGKRDKWGLAVKHKRDYVRRLVIAGALIAAEIDREQWAKL